jgi:hypothetical protein
MVRLNNLEVAGTLFRNSTDLSEPGEWSGNGYDRKHSTRKIVCPIRLVSPRPDQVHLGAGGMNEAFAVDDDEGIV